MIISSIPTKFSLVYTKWQMEGICKDRTHSYPRVLGGVPSVYWEVKRLIDSNDMRVRLDFFFIPVGERITFIVHLYFYFLGGRFLKGFFYKYYPIEYEYFWTNLSNPYMGHE